MAEDSKKLEDALKRISKLNLELKRLGGDAFTDINKAVDSFGGGLKGAESVIKSLNSDIIDLKDNFGTISTTLKNIVDDMGGMGKASKLITRGFDKLESSARKLQEHKNGEYILTIKQIKAEQSKQTLIVKDLKYQLTRLGNSKEDLGIREELEKQLKKENSTLKALNKGTQETLDTEIKIQKTLGITGQLFKGIAKTLQNIGVESESIEDINKSMREAAKNGNGFNVMGAAIKGTFNAVKESLADPAVQITLLLKVFKTLYKVGTDFSQRTADIARNMGLNTRQAHEYNKALIQSFKVSKEQAASVKAFGEANQNINDYLGTSVVFSEQILSNQTALVKRAGLTNEEASRLAELSFITGKTQEEIYDSVGKQNKGILSNRKILSQVLKVSGQLSAQYKNDPKLLAQAVIQANKLGLSLEQTQQISKNLLNFEDSISSELEAELLTGKNLNLEKARYLSLQGKSAEAAEEIAKQMGSSAEFSRMGVIQQEALAKAAGMNVDELADSLVKREAISRLQSEEFKRSGIALSNEEAATKLKEQQMSASEKMATSMESLQDSLASVIAGPLGKMVEMVSSLFNKISQSPIAKFVLGTAGAIGATIAAVGAALMVGRGIINSFKGKPSGRATDPINTRVINAGSLGGDGGGIDLGGGSGGGGGSVKPKGLKRLAKAYKGGGIKGAGKSLTRMGKGLLKGGGKGLLKGAGKGLLKGIPYAGALLSAGMDFAEGGFNWETAGRAGLSGLGAFGGGALGSLVAPGVGTVGGAIGGSMLGDYLGDKIFGEREETPPAEDFIMQGGKMTRFRKDDVVVGGTNLGGGAGNNTEMVTLLKELISTVKNGGNVYLDGTKIGTTMSMSTYKTQ